MELAAPKTKVVPVLRKAWFHKLQKEAWAQAHVSCRNPPA